MNVKEIGKGSSFWIMSLISIKNCTDADLETHDNNLKSGARNCIMGSGLERQLE